MGEEYIMKENRGKKRPFKKRKFQRGESNLCQSKKRGEGEKS